LSNNPYPQIIELTNIDDVLVVRPLKRAGESMIGPFEPFPLPPFPLTQQIFLSQLAETFRCDSDRCIAAALTLHVPQRRWISPVIPHQRCQRDGVSWSLQTADVEGFAPGTVIAGSFQSARGCGVDELLARVPPLDGLHVAHSFDAGRWFVWVFVRVACEARVIEPPAMLENDCRACLHAHQDRLEFL
jgi:hypothetical protein